MFDTSSRHAIALAACIAVAAVLAATVPTRAAPAAAPDPRTAGTIAGSVTSSDGVPIRNAVVSLQGRQVAMSSVTDAAGRFALLGVAAGTYALRVTASGYNPIGPRPIGVTRRATTDVALALVRSSSSLTTIGRIVANGGETLPTSSAPVATVNTQTYAAEGFTRVSDVLQDEMSTTLVHPVGGGSTILPTSVALRGPDPTETLVDIDGHQINSGNSGDFDLSLLDPADYSGIELVKGISPSALVGPDTIDGAINIRTLEPTLTPHGFLRLSAGSFNSFAQTLQDTGTHGRLGYAISLHATTSDGEVNGPVYDTNANAPAIVGSSVDGRTALGKVRYAFGSNGGAYAELSFHDQSATRDLSAALSAYEGSPASDSNGLPIVAAFTGSSLQSHNAGYGLDVRVPIGPTDTAGNEPASVLFRHYTSLVSQSVFGAAADTSPYLYNDRDLSGENSLEFDKQFSNGSLTLQYAIRNEDLAIANYTPADINLQTIARRSTGPLAVARYGMPLDTADVTATPAAGDALLAQTQRSAVVRYIYDPTAKLHLTAAAYYSDYSSFGHFLDPRAGVVYTPDTRSALRFSAGTTYQAPQLPELYVPGVAPAPVGGIVTIGNPNLGPDHATEYGIGASHLIETGPHQTDVAVDFYRVNLRAPAVTYTQPGNLDAGCGPVPSGGDGNPCLLSYAVNAGDGVYTGMEISAQRRLAPALTVHAGYAVRSAYLTSIPPFLQDGTLLLHQQDLGLPLQKATLALVAAPSRGLTFRSTLVYEGSSNELNEPPFLTLAAAVGYRWPDVEVVLSGTNLTNVYNSRFTATGAGVPLAIEAGTQPTDAYALQGAAFNISLARRF